MPEERLVLQGLVIGGGEVRAAHMLPSLAQKARRTHGTIVDGLADFRIDYTDYGANQRTRRVVLAPVPTRVAETVNTCLVEFRELVAFGLGIEGQPVDDIDHIAQDVAGAKLVTQFSEDLADLVLDRTRAFGRLPEGREIGEQIAVDEGDQVVADQGFVMIEATFGRFGRSPMPHRKSGSISGS